MLCFTMPRKICAKSCSALLVCLILLSLCKSHQAQPDGSEVLAEADRCVSFAQVIRSYDFLSTFRSTLIATNMLRALRDENLTVTLLAPTNEAIVPKLQQAFDMALASFNLTKEEALDNPLFLRRVLQMHIIPVPLPRDVLSRSSLSVPTMDFGSRLELKNEGRQTEFMSGDSSASLVDIDITDLCRPSQMYIIDRVLLPSNITATLEVSEDVPEAVTVPFPFAGFFGGALPGIFGAGGAGTGAAGGLLPFTGAGGAAAPAAGMFPFFGAGGAGATGATAPGGFFGMMGPAGVATDGATGVPGVSGGATIGGLPFGGGGAPGAAGTFGAGGLGIPGFPAVAAAGAGGSAAAPGGALPGGAPGVFGGFPLVAGGTAGAAGGGGFGPAGGLGIMMPGMAGFGGPAAGAAGVGP